MSIRSNLLNCPRGTIQLYLAHQRTLYFPQGYAFVLHILSQVFFVKCISEPRIMQYSVADPATG